MKKSFLLIVLVLSILMIASCATAKSTISDTADLDNYKYVCIEKILDYGGSTFLADTEVEVYNVLLQTRLIVKGDREIEALTDEEKSQTLQVKFSATVNAMPTGRVSVNFIDYQTGRPVASCQGQYTGFFTMQEAFDGAIKQVKTEILNLF